MLDTLYASYQLGQIDGIVKMVKALDHHVDQNTLTYRDFITTATRLVEELQPETD